MPRNQAGFAPVKLLLAMISLGIVAAIAVPKGTSSSDRAKLDALRSTVLRAELAEETYYSDHARYATLGQLKTSGFILADGAAMRITVTAGGYTIRASNPTIESKLKECVVRVGGQPISMDGEISCP